MERWPGGVVTHPSVKEGISTPEKSKSNVDVWLERETPQILATLESASKHFDSNDLLSVHTLEAIYGRESSFGIDMRRRGMEGAAGHFHFEKKTARELGLVVTKENDQRFDLGKASSAAARHLKKLGLIFSKKTIVAAGEATIPVRNVVERKKFILAAYNGGQGRISKAQRIAGQAGKNPALWDEVKKFLEATGATPEKAIEIKEFLEKVLSYELEFSRKSPANKKTKRPDAKYRCTDGRWRTIDDRPVMICA